MGLETARWYALIFFSMFFTGIGVPPVPEEAMIIFAAGIEALHPEVRWYLAWPATVAGVLSADAVLYWVGRLWGPHLFEHRWVQKIIRQDRLARLQSRFHDHGVKILLTARLLPPLRTGVFVLAGAIRYPFVRFVFADAAYAVFGVGALFFGSTWMVQLLQLAGHRAVYAVAGLVAAYLLVRYYRRLRENEIKEGTAAPPISVLELPAKDQTAEPAEAVSKARTSEFQPLSTSAHGSPAAPSPETPHGVTPPHGHTSIAKNNLN